MVTVTVFIQDGKKFETHRHTLPYFPSYNDMAVFCKRDRIKAVDFVHEFRSKDKTFYVGRFLQAGGNKGTCSHEKRRGLKFFVRCDTKPTLKELVR